MQDFSCHNRVSIFLGGRCLYQLRGSLLSGEPDSKHPSLSGAGGANDETQPIDIMMAPVEPLLGDAPAEMLDELPTIGADEAPSPEEALPDEAPELPAAADEPYMDVFTESSPGSEATPHIFIYV